MDAIFAAIQMIFSLDALLAIFAGSILGLIFGSIPGLTYSVALALLLPVTFGMNSVAAIALLVSTYIGGMTGGSVSAILVGIPGTPSAAATVMDGHKICQQGRAGAALGMAVLTSTFGGLFSLIIMMALVDVVAGLAIQFGPAEIFALVLFGLSTICGLAGKSLTRGLIGGVIGLMLMVIGMDQIEGIPRMTFGNSNLLQGVDLLVAMVGLFAVPQVINSFLQHGQHKSRHDEPGACLGGAKPSVELPSLREFFGKTWLMIRCALMGTGIGAIPGAGGPIAAFLAYGHARRFSKNKENFGHGEMDGVVAPETANNAVTGGTMIPLLSLGIPGDPATAILLVGLMIHGLTPGPMLFVENAPEVYSIYLAITFAYLAVLGAQLCGIRLFVRVLSIPPHLLSVGILVMCGVGAFAVRNSIADVYVMAVMGLAGYLLQRVNIPITPIVLGLVLGKTLEGQYRMAMISSEGSVSVFLSSPIAVVFIALTVITVGMQLAKSFQSRRENTKDGSASEVS